MEKMQNANKEVQPQQQQQPPKQQQQQQQQQQQPKSKSSSSSTSSSTPKIINDEPSLRLNIKINSLASGTPSLIITPSLIRTKSRSSISSLNSSERLFPLPRKFYIGKHRRHRNRHHNHNNNNYQQRSSFTTNRRQQQQDDYDDYNDDDDNEHFNWIDYGNMKPKEIEAIKSFCCNQSILLILALIIFVLWHAAFYDNLNDLDRQTIEFWFTDLNNLPNKYIDQYLKEYRFSTRKIKIFDSWIITNVLLSLMIFITGMIAMCFRSHNNSRNAMKIYRWIVIPLLLIFIISLFVFTYFLFKYWILFASGSAIKFIYENYNNNQHYYRWLMVYVHHTNQWLNCCDWYYLLEEYEQNNQSNQNFGHTNDSIPLSCCKQLKQYDHSLHSVGYFFNHQFNLTIINNKNYNYNDTLLKGTDFDSWCATKRILSTFERQCALSPIIVIMIILLIIIQSIVIIDISRLISISFYL